MSSGVFSRSNVSRNVVAPSWLRRGASATVAGRTRVVMAAVCASFALPSSPSLHTPIGGDDSVDPWRDAIERILTKHAAEPYAHGDIRSKVVFDRAHDSYLVVD